MTEYTKFKKWLGDNCFDECEYGEGKYDKKIFEYFKKPSAVKGKKFTPKWNIQLSDCCQYITKVVGDETKHYECMKCGKPCDVDTSKKEKCEHICSDCGSQSFSCDSCGEHLPDHPSKPRIEPLDLTLKGGGGSYASQVGETFLMVKDKVNEIITLLNSEK